jgi:phosphoglycolate phosphatase-like HAD superfamily hydrolase
MNAYIFDLDGTLLDSMDVWEQIDIDFLIKRGFEVPPDYINAVCARSFTEVAVYTIDSTCPTAWTICCGNGTAWRYTPMATPSR